MLFGFLLSELSAFGSLTVNPLVSDVIGLKVLLDLHAVRAVVSSNDSVRHDQKSKIILKDL